MNSLTKIEKAGLRKFSEAAREKLTLILFKEKIDRHLIFDLQDFFGSKTERAIIQKSIAHVASSLIVRDTNLLEASNYGRLGLIQSIRGEERIGSPFQKSDDDLLKIPVMTWQLILIMSKAESTIGNEHELVDFCLFESLKSKRSLFGDT
jgi:hypothetical protein